MRFKSKYISNSIVILLLIFNITSCSFKSNTCQFILPEDIKASAIPIKGEKLLAEYITTGSFNCVYTPDGFIGAMPINNNKIIHLADIETGEIIASACPKGRGPQELLVGNPHKDYYNGKLYLLDMATNRIKSVTVDDDSLKIENLFTYKGSSASFILAFNVINDTTFAFFTQRRQSAHVFIVNHKNKVLDSLDYRVIEDKRIKNEKLERVFISMNISPNRKDLFIVNRLFNSVKKYNIENNKLSFDKEKFIVEPRYYVKNGLPKDKKDNLILDSEIFVSEKYLYLVTQPEYRSDYNKRVYDDKGKVLYVPDNTHIIVMDYDMNYIRTYKCDHYFKRIALTNKDGVFYAADIENHCLQKYTFPYL